MTIAEIIAAKKAKDAAPPAKVQAYADNNGLPPKESLAERAAAQEAIDRIDPPGKSSQRKAAGIILNKDMPAKPESRGQRTPIAGPPEEPEPRSLSTTELQAVPMVPVDADPKVVAWHDALNAFETELCLMLDPKDPERAWIAVRLDGQEQWPILLKSLPFYHHPRTERPLSEPF